jgi:HEAT repeat protein
MPAALRWCFGLGLAGLIVGVCIGVTRPAAPVVGARTGDTEGPCPADGRQQGESLSQESVRLLALAKNERLGLKDRAYAVTKLGELREKAALRPLVQLLWDGGSDVPTFEIVIALGRLEDARAIPHLKRLRDDPNAQLGGQMYAQIYHAILNCEPVSENARALLKTIEDREVDVSARVQAAKRLGELRDPATVNRLLRMFIYELLRQSGEGSLFRELALALGNTGDPRVPGELAEFAHSNLVPAQTRSACRQALANWRLQFALRLPWIGI